MKVAISSCGQDLNASIDQRFGRCAYFLIVETEDMSFEVFNNTSTALGGGAGIQSAQFAISKGAEAVITGNCGPNAVQTLTAGGAKVFLGVTGTIQAALEKYKSGKLTPAAQANAAEHSGLSVPTSIDRGKGWSGRRNMGLGAHISAGRGFRRNRNMP